MSPFPFPGAVSSCLDALGLQHGKCVTVFSDLVLGYTVTPADPIWVEVSEAGVKAPGSEGGGAPLIKGVRPTELKKGDSGVGPLGLWQVYDDETS